MADFSEIALARGLSLLAETQASIAHNLANVQSTAYKRRAPLAQRTADHFHALLDTRLPTLLYRERTSWTQGDVRATGNAFHVALEGEGFFLVQDDSGRRFYTRNGEMVLDRDGRLSTASGLRFLDRNGAEIVMRNDQGDRPASIRVAPDGTITDGTSGSRVWGPLGVFAAPDRDRLRPVGRSLFADPGGRTPLPSTARVQHKHLEGSNVESLRELVQMISVQRTFQASAQALSTLGRIKRSFVQAINR